MSTPNYGVWPPAGLNAQGWAVIDGATGAALKQAGGIFGTFSHVGAGQCRVQLNMSIPETELIVGVLALGTDNGGGASVTRTIGYAINAAASPPELNIYSRDAAGVLADCPKMTIAVLAVL
jgi:hypothetical protein